MADLGSGEPDPRGLAFADPEQTNGTASPQQPQVDASQTPIEHPVDLSDQEPFQTSIDSNGGTISDSGVGSAVDKEPDQTADATAAQDPAAQQAQPPPPSFTSIVLSRHNADITFGEALWEKLDGIRDKGAHGVKVCRAVAAFLHERADVEEAFGKALLKAVKNASAALGGWAPRLCGGDGWGGVLAALRSIGKQHVGLGICVRQNLSRVLEVFTATQAQEVQRLGDQASCVVKEMEALQARYYKTKSAYEKACIDATRAVEARNKAQAEAAAAGADARVAAAAAPTPRSGGAKGASLMLNKMLSKAGEGVTKMGMAKGQGTAELEERARTLAAQVDGKEQAYIEAVMQVNGFCAEFQAVMEAKLDSLQGNEEARVAFLKDLLLRLHSAAEGTLENLTGAGAPLTLSAAALSSLAPRADAEALAEFMRARCGQWGAAALGGGGGGLSRDTTGAGEEGARAVFEGVRAWGLEAARALQAVCGVLGDVASAQESYSR